MKARNPHNVMAQISMRITTDTAAAWSAVRVDSFDGLGVHAESAGRGCPEDAS